MAAYVVLARKWRPARFSDIVGQGPVVRTLMNAIQSQRLHHAYLLTGSRGIGKTSIARIFAKAVRCPNAQVVDGWLRSCEECASCKEIAAGNSVDVNEIDGASNNGVDAVREIRENARYLPSSGSKKFYIIDEVHMLTAAAFNALLKTLEEPPEHVIFVLATTESHKIPATILSRLQRFDLKRVTPAQVNARLSEVAKAEGIEIEPGALALLSRAAEGSMRDALSLFDQVIAFAGMKITTANVRESIGLIEGQAVLGILDGIFSRKPLDALALIEQAYAAGHDLKLLARNLIEFLHAAILAKVGANESGTLELAPEEWSKLKKIAEKRALEEIELFFQVFQHGVEWIARSPQPRIVIEVLVIKCASAEALVSATTVSGTVAGGAPARGPVSMNASPIPPAAQAPTVRKTESAPSVPAPTPAANAAPGSLADIMKSLGSAPASKSADSSPTEHAAPAYSGPRTWEAFVAFVKARRPLLASVLEHAACGKFPGVGGSEEFVVYFGSEEATYFKSQLEARASVDALNAITQEFFGKITRIQGEIREGVEGTARKRERELQENEAAARKAVENHPLIAEARQLFGGEMGPVELIQNPENPEGGGKRAN